MIAIPFLRTSGVAGFMSLVFAIPLTNGNGNTSLVHTAESLHLTVPIPYASTDEIPLRALSVELGTTIGLALSQVSGPSFLYCLRPGNVLAILAPTEQFHDTTSVLLLTSADKSWFLSLRWSSVAKLATSSIDDKAEDASHSRVSLDITGPTPDGLVGPHTTSLRFQLRHAPPIAGKLTDVTLSTEFNTRVVSEWFRYESQNSILVLREQHAPKLFKVVRAAASVTLFLFSTKDGRAIAFEQALVWAPGRIKITVTDWKTTTATALQSRITVRGDTSGCTRVLNISRTGIACTEGLPYDTYRIMHADIAHGTKVLSTVELSAETSDVALQVRSKEQSP